MVVSPPPGLRPRRGGNVEGSAARRSASGKLPAASASSTAPARHAHPWFNGEPVAASCAPRGHRGAEATGAAEKFGDQSNRELTAAGSFAKLLTINRLLRRLVRWTADSPPRKRGACVCLLYNARRCRLGSRFCATAVSIRPVTVRLGDAVVVERRRRHQGAGR